MANTRGTVFWGRCGGKADPKARYAFGPVGANCPVVKTSTGGPKGVVRFWPGRCELPGSQRLHPPPLRGVARNEVRARGETSPHKRRYVIRYMGKAAFYSWIEASSSCFLMAAYTACGSFALTISV
jgi:hypothetical protein